MQDVWVTVASLLLAGVFAWSGSTKILRSERWRLDLVTYRLNRPLRAAGLLLLPWIEVGIAGALVAGATRAGAFLAMGALAIFCVAIIRARILLGTDKLGCGCFGGAKIRDYRLLLARNVVLGALAAVVVSTSSDPSFTGALDLGGSSGLVWLISALALLAVAWVLWQASQRMRRGDHP
jgi:Methylamine utilisation protein MauE